MEIMTEFVFREKLKNRRKYSMTDMFPDPCDQDSDENSDEEDLKDDMRNKYLSGPKNSGENSEEEDGENSEEDEENSDEEDEPIVEVLKAVKSMKKKN